MFVFLLKASSTHCSYVLRWIKHGLDLLQNCVDPTQQCIVKLHGNQKVLKASLEFITSFAEIQRSRGKECYFCGYVLHVITSKRIQD